MIRNTSSSSYKKGETVRHPMQALQRKEKKFASEGRTGGISKSMMVK